MLSCQIEVKMANLLVTMIVTGAMTMKYNELSLKNTIICLGTGTLVGLAVAYVRDIHTTITIDSTGFHIEETPGFWNNLLVNESMDYSGPNYPPPLE